MTLAPELRGLLEDACVAARREAERAVRDAIARVKAGPESPLRRRLRAQEEQEAAHFVEHAAFTQWTSRRVPGLEFES